MKKYRSIFKKNLSLMLVLVMVAIIGIIAIEKIKNRTNNISTNPGEVFCLPIK